MDEDLLERVENVKEYCRHMMTTEPSVATGVNICAMIWKQMATDILYILGEDVTNCEVQYPLNYTLGNNERELQ